MALLQEEARTRQAAADAQIAQLQQELQTLQAPPTVTPPSTTSPFALSPEFLQSIVTAVTAAMPRQTTETKPSKSEKLPELGEYDGNMDTLDAWEQGLIRRMHANHDRYPTEIEKITYAESRLTIGKKAHNLMNRYRKDGPCTLTELKDWRKKLRQAWGNRFEEEDARTYLRDTLKQGTMSFEEYYNLFTQEERSGMEDASLIDAMRSNVGYATQAAAISWRKEDGTKPVTFDDHVQMWADTDWDLRQLKHRHPRSTPAITVSNNASTCRRGNASVTTNSTTTTTQFPPPANTARTPSSTSATAAPATASPAGDPMDLSSAIAAVRGLKLTEPGVRRICELWKL